MINNILSYTELEKIFLPILKLESIEVIKENIYNVLHFSKGSPNDTKQYRICAETTGVNSIYKNFEIEIRRLEDKKNGYSGVIIQFRKKKLFKDFFSDPTKQIIIDLKSLCVKEIHEAWFNRIVLGRIIKENEKYQFLYQIGTLNPDWEKQNKLSPLTIFTHESKDSYLIEFLFTPLCYERTSDKTVLKNNWLELFTLYTPSW
ncbi:MAG TPA: hypothetical protein VLC98_00815 [Phnomibacter sp.]|nr:hypothetical protein [Phnomibacter sp.]